MVGCLLAPLAATAQDEMSAEDATYELIDAVYEDSARDVTRLLEAGADANATTESGLPIVSYAAIKGLEDVAAALVGAGADLEAQDQTGATALMYAAQFDHDDLVTALLEAGADVNAVDSLGWTPLMRAVIGGNAEAVTAIKDAGADLSAVDFFERNARQIAEGRDLEEIIAILES